MNGNPIFFLQFNRSSPVEGLVLSIKSTFFRILFVFVKIIIQVVDNFPEILYNKRAMYEFVFFNIHNQSGEMGLGKIMGFAFVRSNLNSCVF